jgi:hypothetical protein
MPAALTRFGAVGFKVTDNLTFVQTGFVADSTGSNATPAGQGPLGIAVGSGDLPPVFISLSTANALLSIVPYHTEQLSNLTNNRVLR